MCNKALRTAFMTVLCRVNVILLKCCCLCFLFSTRTGFTYLGGVLSGLNFPVADRGHT